MNTPKHPINARLLSKMGILSIFLIFLNSCDTPQNDTPSSKSLVGHIIDDAMLETELYDALQGLDMPAQRNNITFKVHNNFILAVGQVEDTINSKRVKKLLESFSKKNAYNVKIAPLPTTSETLEDTWITTQIKTALPVSQLISIKVLTEKQQVYLLGSATKKEHDEIIQTIKEIKGIKKIHNFITITPHT